MRIILLIVILFSFYNCVEPHRIETETYEDVLIIEGRINDVVSVQKIKLSRAQRIEQIDEISESNATIWIEDSHQEVFSFHESSNGVYSSNIEFAAQPDTSYQLFISTSDGKRYESQPVDLTTQNAIENLYAQTETINGAEGVQIYATVNSNADNSEFYRYEFEETYESIIPSEYLSIFDIRIENGLYGEFDLIIYPKDEDDSTCYTTENSSKFILSNVFEVADDNNLSFPVNFLEKTNHKIRNRYSILVKQYVLTRDTYFFYKTLRDLGSVENLLLETQPGFVIGNVHSVDSDEKVIGFFEANSISSKRIFLSYSDFDFPKPQYPYECIVYTLDYNDNTSLDGDRNDRILIKSILSGQKPFRFVEKDLTQPIYTFVNPECGDCTTYSSNIIPEFW